MCGRYVLKKEDLEALVRQFGLRSLEEFHSRYNIAPTSIVPLIRRHKNGDTELSAVRWGLIPAWSKPDAPVRPLVNVRAETLLSRFKGALKSRRCVLPASGFYEWEARGAKKQPWYFSLRDGRPFGLAGFWDTWRGGAGVELETCTVITTEPNAALQPVHDRMPVMLTPEQCTAWVRADAGDTATLEALLRPAPDGEMVTLKVGPAVSNVRNDGPECIAPAPDEPGETEAQLSFGL